MIVERWNGIKFEKPYARVRDMATMLKAAFAGEKVSETLETLATDGMRLSRHALAPPPKLYIAALREKMLMLAGAESDGPIINWLGAKDVPKAVAAARKGAERAGKNPGAARIVCRIFVCMTDDEAIVGLPWTPRGRGYLTVPVYAKFHEWSVAASCCGRCGRRGRGDRKDRDSRDPARDDRRPAGLRQRGDVPSQDPGVRRCRRHGAGAELPASDGDPKQRARQSVERLRELAPGQAKRGRGRSWARPGKVRRKAVRSALSFVTHAS